MRPITGENDAAREPESYEVVVALDDMTQRPSLRRWLDGTDELRGRLDVTPAPARPGELGPDPETVRLLIESAGAVALAVESVMLWLKSRRSDVTIEVSVGDRRITVKSNSLRNASTGDLAELTRDTVRALTEE
jgi:hypothetical protein